MEDITISTLFEGSVYKTRKLLSGLKRNLQESPYILKVLTIVVYLICALILLMSKPFHESTTDALKVRHQSDINFRSNKL